MNRFSLRLGTVFLVSLLLVLFSAGFAEASFAYTVQGGDSLYLIGNRYGVSVSALKTANGLSGNTIYAGQRLTIPGGTSTGTRYTVVRGDSLFLIAQRYGTSVAELKRANNLASSTVYPGQVLNIGGGAGSVRTASVSRALARSDYNLLAQVVYAEARGEVYEGQVAVAAVILNRVKNPNFPSSIPGIIYEPGAFTAVDDGQINMTPDATAYKAVQDALNGWDPTYGALYYWNPSTATSKWVWSRQKTVTIGNHIFAK